MDRAQSQDTLTPKQYGLLILLYKFRYISVPLLTEYKNLKSNSLQRSFDILLDQELVEREYESSYKIDRKPALYFLSKRGIAFLKKDDRLNGDVLHSYYKNKSLSLDFMQHKLDTLAVFNSLRASCGYALDIFTHAEVTAAEDFPDTKPDLFLRATDRSREYFVTLAHDLAPFLIKKRLAEYIDHSEDVGWEAADHYPTLLFIFADSGQEARFLEHAGNVLEGMGIDNDELSIGATTIKALRTQPYTSAVWTFVGSDKPIALS